MPGTVKPFEGLSSAVVGFLKYKKIGYPFV